jgi:3',5'-cyclic AMP phosphodiesterase CpdA
MQGFSTHLSTHSTLLAVPTLSYTWAAFQIRQDGQDDCDVSNAVLTLVQLTPQSVEVTLIMDMRPQRYCSGSDNPVTVNARFLDANGGLIDSVRLDSLKEGKSNYQYASDDRWFDVHQRFSDVKSAELYFAGGNWSDP